jgi:hypothetical protein
MKFMIRGRQAGKTHESILHAARTGAYIVCADRERAKHIHRMAMDMRVRIPPPITFDDLMNHRFFGRRIPGFIYEDAEALLQLLACGVPVELVTATGESV